MMNLVPTTLCRCLVSIILPFLVPPLSLLAHAEDIGSCVDESCDADYTSPPIANDGSIEFAFGKRQEVGLSPSKEMVALMRNMNNYMQDQDQKRCTLNYDQCVNWASIGECSANPSLMQKECAPACLTCALALMTFEERCPLPSDMHKTNAFQNGDINRMFERFVNDEKIRTDYGLNVLLHPGMSNAIGPQNESMPWIVTLDTFLSGKECDLLIQHGHQIGYEQSGVVGEDPKSNLTKQSRTSSTAWCRAACYQAAAPILERIERLTGIPQPNFEHLQILQYRVGQFYKVHSDYIQLHLERAHGPRLLTVFLYLNDVEQGGGTNFPLLNITVQPKRGRALIWPSVMNDDLSLKEWRTDHQALPVEKGVKYSANAWIHLRDFQTPFDQNCL